MIPVNTQNPLRQILAFGQSLWYDGLISVKEFETLIREDGIRGATTNPTIFEKVLAGGENDALIHKALAEGALPEDIYKAQAVRTVREVADTFLPVFRQTQGADGFVSNEVSPLLARDTEGTLKEKCPP